LPVLYRHFSNTLTDTKVSKFWYTDGGAECTKVEKPTFESKKGHKTHESAKETSGGYRKTLPLHGQGLARF